MKTFLRYAVLTAVVGAIVLLLLDIVVMPFYVREGSDRYLPDVTGMVFDEAKSTLVLEGF